MIITVDKRKEHYQNTRNDDTTAAFCKYVARFDGGGEIVGFGGGDYKKSRPWCSLFVCFTHRGVVAVCTRFL